MYTLIHQNQDGLTVVINNNVGKKNYRIIRVLPQDAPVETEKSWVEQLKTAIVKT